MASQKVSPFENQTVEGQFVEVQNTWDQFPILESSTEDNTSDYSSCFGEAILGSVQRRTSRCKCTEADVDRRSSLAIEILKQEEANEVSAEFGDEWKLVARYLGIKHTTIDQVDKNNSNYSDKGYGILAKFMQQEGCGATKGRLADALIKAGRRDLAEKMGFEIKKENNAFFTFEVLEKLIHETVNGCKRISYKCRDINTGERYVVQKFENSGFEEASQFLKQPAIVADSLPMDPDSNTIEDAEKATAGIPSSDEIQKQLTELEKRLQEITDTLEKQERHEDKIDVQQQLEEDEVLLRTMQQLGSELNRQTGTAGHLEHTFLLKARMYSFSIDMTSTLKDLKERINMLGDMATNSREDELPGASTEHGEKAKKMTKWCKNLEKQIKIRDKKFEECFKERQQMRQRRNCSPSDPNPLARKREEDYPIIRRASTQPISEKELKELAEQVSPPVDPMEEEEDGIRNLRMN